MRPSFPIFKIHADRNYLDYLRPGYLAERMEHYRQQVAQETAAQKSALEQEELERIQKVRPMTRTAR